MKQWNPYLKPPAEQCPEEFCFHWAPKGAFVAPGLHSSLAQAMKAAMPVGEGQCVCSFGLCKRLYPDPGSHDWYEPHEPNLERHGLPWFYFIPTSEKLVEESREEYVRESRRLWGESPHHTSDED